MCCMRRKMFLAAIGTCLAILGPEGSFAQEGSRIDRIRENARGPGVSRPPVSTLPIQRPVPSGWQLGLHADKTDLGMLVTSVNRGSAADRAGLERGDRILAVGDERVGFVGSRGVSMRNALARQADFRGHVVLLVQSRRHRGLTNVSVHLDRVGGPQFFSN